MTHNGALGVSDFAVNVVDFSPADEHSGVDIVDGADAKVNRLDATAPASSVASDNIDSDLP